MAKQGRKVNINSLKSIIGKDAYNKIGSYEERAGGGDVLEKGESFYLADNVKEAEEHRKTNPEDKVRVLQPRDENGRFAHNSVNKRDRKYKDRSTTLPAFLRYVDLPYVINSKTPLTSEDKVVLAGINMTVEKFIALMINYNEDEWRNLENVVTRVKQGRRSKAEQESLARTSDDIITDKKMKGAYYLNELDLNLRTFNRYRNKYGGYLIKDNFHIHNPSATGERRTGRNQEKVAPRPTEFVKNKGFGGVKSSKKAPKTTTNVNGAPKTTTNVKETSQSKSNTFDSGLAKSDPVGFVKQHAKDLLEMSDMTKGKLGVADIIDLIESGKVKNREDFEALI